MKPRAPITICLAIWIALFLVVAVGSVTPAAAQAPEPPRPITASREGAPRPQGPAPQQDADGVWYMPTGAVTPRSAAGLVATLGSGGPDDFGYTWEDVSLAWIDAGGGVDTGIDNSRAYTGPVDIGFPFKFYENTYTQLYISRYGFVSFGANYLWVTQSRVPSPGLPNNVIAPHWVPVHNVAGYVRYLRGGAAPNRWFLVEWNRLESNCCGSDELPDEYTFQVIFHENGDIVFQYGAMTVNGSYFCQSSGIEDATGLDGLAITGFCRRVEANHAVRIYRPAPMARVRPLYPLLGSFVRPGQAIDLALPLRNTGDLGVDTYEIGVSSAWTTTLSLQGNPLNDSNGDAQPDTGPVGQGQTLTLTLTVQVPPDLAVGAHEELRVTARSTRNPDYSRTILVRLAVPTAFVQVFRDSAQGAMQTYMAQPRGQAVRTVTDPYRYGWDGVVAALPTQNFLYLWRKGRYDPLRQINLAYLEYVLLDRHGNPIGPARRLTDHREALYSTNERTMALDAAINGWVGVAWIRYAWRQDDQGQYLYNFNVYAAILNPDGSLRAGPMNLTNNTAWGAWDAENVPRFFTPRVVATGDNRFLIAWEQDHRETDGWVYDIWYAVLNGDGSFQTPPTRLTQDTPGWEDRYEYPVATHLSDNRALILFRRADGDLYFTTVDERSGTAQPMTRLDYTPNGSPTPADLLRLPNGRLALALSNYYAANLGEAGWQASYFNNETLSGPPVLTRQELTIDHAWDIGSPDALVNPDHFSVRWEGTITVPEGDYRFQMYTDDGGRLWIDDRLVLDRWDTCCEFWDTTVRLREGSHTVRMEMFERDGAASARLKWYRQGYIGQVLLFDEDGRVTAGPVSLMDGGAVTAQGPLAPSLSLDGAGRLVLTWTDAEGSYRPFLYYALLDGNGAVLTPPTVFYRAQAEARAPLVLTPYDGGHNAPYIWTPPTGVDTSITVSPELAAGPPGGQAQLSIRYANYGADLSMGTVLTATLGGGLAYLEDTSGLQPEWLRRDGNQVVWRVPDLPLLAQHEFWLTVAVPEGAEYGARYPVQAEIGSQGPEIAPQDNRAAREVMAARQLHLPRIERWY